MGANLTKTGVDQEPDTKELHIGWPSGQGKAAWVCLGSGGAGPETGRGGGH